MPLRSVGAGLYLVSYLRNWFFPQIAKVAFALAMEGLITDTLRASLDLTGRVQADFEGVGLVPDALGVCAYLSRASTPCCDWLAWASMAVAAWAMICDLARLVDSLA